MSYTDPQQRHDFVYLFDVINGNPNGDPDAGNLPRIDPETNHGLVTDVALKRKVRDYISLTHQGQARNQIFIQSQVALNTLIVQAYAEADIQLAQLPLANEELIDWFREVQPEGFEVDEIEGQSILIYDGSKGIKVKDIRTTLLDELADEHSSLKKSLEDLSSQLAKAARKPSRAEQDSARSRLADKFYDIRLFGAVLSTGLNAGQVRGPMQLTFARSVDPIVPLDISITRVAITRPSELEAKRTEMGRKAIVPYGLYRAHGFYNPFLAKGLGKEKETGVTEGDLALFWEALSNMFNYDHSAARGEMACRGLYIFSHETPIGNAPTHKLFERIQVCRKDGVESPRHFSDYIVAIDTQGLPQGISLTPLAE
jgi:CRISPR-associated protein Csd2